MRPAIKPNHPAACLPWRMGPGFRAAHRRSSMVVMESASDQPRIVVIGGGIVGLCVAWHLAKRGKQPLVLEAHKPGGASSGNAGAISHGSVAPLAMPGVLRDVPGMLMDPKGALHIPMGYWLKAAPWLMRFVASARTPQVEAAATALAALFFGTLERHKEILAAEGAPELIREAGQIYLYRDAAQLAKAEPGLALRRRHGLRMEVLDRAALAALEPAVSPAYTLGVYLPDHGSSVNPGRFAEVVAGGVQRQGGEVRRAEVRAIRTEGRRVTGVETEAGVIPADEVVIAAGAWSARLLASLGVKVPLETQRGYHMMLPDAGVTPGRVLSPQDRKVFISPMEEGLRVAGSVEIAGLDAPPNESRAQLLLGDLRAVFPDARTDGATSWMGHRPCLPDSMPVIGPSVRYAGLWCGFGHGHLGVTSSAVTGDVLASAMLGDRPTPDLGPYALERF